MSKPKKEMLLLALPANSGKTFTINVLYHKCMKFKQDMSILDYDELDPKSQEAFQKIKDIEYKNQDKDGDIQEAVEINGITIGFASRGDDLDAIRKNMKFFKENKCDIYVTACSCDGILDKRQGKDPKERVQEILDFVKKQKCCISTLARMMFDRLKYLLSV